MTRRTTTALLVATATWALGFALLGRAGATLAARLGDGLGATLALWVPAGSPEQHEHAEVQPGAAPAPSASVRLAVAPEAGERRVASAAPRPLRGVRVRAERVLSLANAGVRPRGVPVPASAEHPAGLRLSGVSSLGVGLEDGDVLTRASGRATLSQASVIGAVIAERAAHSREISGVFWRRGEAWNLLVEQPYAAEGGERATDAAASCRRTSCPPGRTSDR